jgi:hypothetical protein
MGLQQRNVHVILTALGLIQANIGQLAKYASKMLRAGTAGYAVMTAAAHVSRARALQS